MSLFARQPVFVTAGTRRFTVLDRNQRARLMFSAEALDRRTHEKGMHGGALKRTGLAVLKALVFAFHNVTTGRCEPSYDSIARAAGVARGSVGPALARLEAAGLVVRTPRLRWVHVNGGRVAVQATNAYAFNLDPGSNPGISPENSSRPETTKAKTLSRLSATSVPPRPLTSPLSSRRKDTREELLASARRLGIPLKGKG